VSTPFCKERSSPLMRMGKIIGVSEKVR
jgi:hypothetical protein